MARLATFKSELFSTEMKKQIDHSKRESLLKSLQNGVTGGRGDYGIRVQAPWMVWGELGRRIPA